jgi:hypothetical protein
MCKCGCRGWCSLWPLLYVVAWDLNLGAEGKFAKNRHDNSPFDIELDGFRIERNESGVDLLALFLAVVEFRGDWPAMTEVAAVRNWAHKYHPCMFCHISLAQLKAAIACSGFSLDAGPFPDWTDADHRAEVTRCTISVHVHTLEVRSQIVRALRYLKRAFGRALAYDIPALSLKRFDRLEPELLLPDVSKFEAIDPPFTVKFWRMNIKDDRVLHDSPLFHIIGVGWRNGAVDILHGLHIGTYPCYIGYVIETFLDMRNFAGHYDAFLDADDIKRINLAYFKSLLLEYYSNRRRTDPDWQKRGSEVFLLNFNTLVF